LVLVSKFILTILGLEVIIGLIVIGVSFFNQLACEGQLINNNVDPTPDQQIFGDHFIGQTFISPYEGLNRIDIFFQTYRRRNTHEVTLRLLEIPPGLNNPLEGTELYRTQFNAAQVEDKTWRQFSLPPLANSTKKHYMIVLESPASEAGNAITVGGIERDSYLPGSAFFGPIPVPADVTFRVCYQLSPGQKLEVFVRQLTQNRPGPWGNSGFYGISLFVYASLVIFFFWKLSRVKL
jgi:hypothetical protein